MANGSCYHHGGASLKGIASPTFKHGRRSKYLPHRLLERYEDAQTDPELLEFKADLALLETRLGELLGRIDTGESGALWRAAMKAYEDLQAARKAGDTPKMAAALNVLGEMLERGVGESATWDEIYRVLGQRGRTLEREQNRILKAEQVFNESQMLGLTQVLLDSVKRNVADPRALGAIQSDLLRFLGPCHAAGEGGGEDP